MTSVTSLDVPGYDKGHLDHIIRDLDTALNVLETPLISFVDPLFGGDKKQTLPLLDALRGNDIRFTFYTQVDVLDEEVFAALGDNCNLMFVGLEAVSESSLIYMNKTHNAEQYIAKMGETMRLAANTVSPHRLGSFQIIHQPATNVNSIRVC